jgi:hypothetical protein
MWHSYDAAYWHFGRGSEWLNFPDLTSREETKFFTPPPNLQMREDRQPASVTSERS